MKPRLGIYPFCDDVMEFAMHPHLAHYEIRELISPPGWRLDGKIVESRNGNDGFNLCVTSEFSNALDNCDAVLLSYYPDLHSNLVECLRVSKAKCKRIIVTRDFAEVIGQSEIPANVAIVSPEMLADKSNDISVLDSVNVPVVMVFGQGEMCQKFDIQLGLRQAFLDKDYRVSQVGSSIYSSMFGFPCFPLFDHEDMPAKIISLNKFFNQLIERENSDVLIVGVPGGIMPINKHITHRHGETAFVAATAAQPDISVLSMYHGSYNDEYIDHLCSYMKYHLGSITDYIHISNVEHLVSSYMPSKFDYLRVENITRLNFDVTPKDTSYRLFNCDMLSASKQVYNDIISELENNVEII